jgi:hypothetical protein
MAHANKMNAQEIPRDFIAVSLVKLVLSFAGTGRFNTHAHTKAPNSVSRNYRLFMRKLKSIF